MRAFRGTAVVVLALLYLTACGEGPVTPPPESGPALTIVSGAGQADTIWATPAPVLRVRVLAPDRRGDGSIRPGLASVRRTTHS